MQNPSRRSTISLAGPPACSGVQGWADLPDELLHPIVARLGSFRDILGFAATCPSWRTAYSSHPSKSTFRTRFPPLLIQPRVRQRPLLPPTDGCRELLTCKVVDPANPNAALRCQIPQETLENMKCIGSSYGNLIYYCNGCCRIVDVFTGLVWRFQLHACLPLSAKNCTIYGFNGILTAPVASPNSHLLVSTTTSYHDHESYFFDWPVGSDSWSQVRIPYMWSVDQIVEFNGEPGKMGKEEQHRVPCRRPLSDLFFPRIVGGDGSLEFAAFSRYRGLLLRPCLGCTLGRRTGPRGVSSASMAVPKHVLLWCRRVIRRPSHSSRRGTWPL
ncbi:uncharacterized protein LOC123401812 [Hordeum vulgare subsp. vulgare]|uniref:uncharacterized protein LOC123401812 n=1 Tax=Hordeum vulgare subsp. vulgare TaxID=112509 RepID=UPI001D1A5081|nr:uncharacterized protein LOC123401812 [Hordeum vulgare subsp. vulgare]